MVKHRPFKWIWIPLIIFSILTIVESKIRHKRATFGVTDNYQHIISRKNHQDLLSNSILIPNKRSSKMNGFEETIMMTGTTSKTLLDLEKSQIFDDLNKRIELEESSKDAHIRVKRTDSEFDKSDNQRQSLMHLKNNYFEDLRDSFPGKSLNVEYPSLRSNNHVELSKRSNDSNEYYNTSNCRDVSSNSNETFVGIQVTETNRYFDNHITHTMLSKIVNNNVEGKFETNDSILNIAEVNKTRIKRENKSKNNTRRKVGHGKKRKMRKHLAGKGKNKVISSKTTGKRHSDLLKTMLSSKIKRKNHMIQSNSPKTVESNIYKDVESKLENQDSVETKIDVPRKKEMSDNKRSSRERSDNELAEETLIKENKDLTMNDIIRDKRSLLKKDVLTKNDMSWYSKNRKFRSKRNGNNDLTIPKYLNVLESTSSSILSENKVLSDKPRGDREVKSIEEIKELAEKLVTKVNELQSYLSYKNEKDNSGRDKKKLESREIEVPRDNNATVEEEEVVLETPKLVDECVRIGDLSSALKTLDDRNASLDKITRQEEESETVRMNLLNNRMNNSLTKRMIRKNRIKRKSHRKWGRWTGWSSCSVTCGKGRQIRWRHCLRDCSTVETEMEEKACQMPACPPGKFLGIF